VQQPVGFYVLVRYGERELMLYRAQDRRFYAAPKRLLPSRVFATLEDAKRSLRSSAMSQLLVTQDLLDVDIEVVIRQVGGPIVWRKLYTDKPLKALVYQVENIEAGYESRRDGRGRGSGGRRAPASEEDR
jgi:hypothetical protein